MVSFATVGVGGLMSAAGVPAGGSIGLLSLCKTGSQ